MLLFAWQQVSTLGGRGLWGGGGKRDRGKLVRNDFNKVSKSRIIFFLRVEGVGGQYRQEKGPKFVQVNISKI